MIVNFVNQHADHFLQVGLHFLWQGTAIAIFAALANRFVCQTPRQRANLYLGSLVALLLCLPMTLLALDMAAPSETLAVSNSQSAITQAASVNIPVQSPAEAENVAMQNSVSLSSWIVGVYLVGLLLMIARVLGGYHWSRKIRRAGNIVSEEPWPDALSQALASMKLKNKPVMLWSKEVTSPVITGIVRPMIVLPISIMSGLPREQAIAILSHELAHLSRFDHLVVVFERLLEALFFFHPAVWYLCRRLDQEREEACDDLVVQAGHNRADYAEVLVKIASDQPSILALAAAKNVHLKERILRIPWPAATRKCPGKRWRLAGHCHCSRRTSGFVDFACDVPRRCRHRSQDN